MLRINLEWDANAQAAPQSFRDGVQEAANILEAAIDDPITVNIAVGYNEVALGKSEYQPLTGSVSMGGEATPIQIAYPALQAVLAANETTALNTQEIDALPAASALGGQSTFEISSALAKTFGALPANDTAVDGYIGFPSDFTADNGLVQAAIVEEAHAMGLMNASGPLGLFSYTSAGTHFLPSGGTASTPAYFSTDGGTTALASYDVGFDATLFSNVAHDPLSLPNTSSNALTPLDLTELSAVGFDVTSTPSLATPDVTPGVTAPGTTAAVTVQNVSVAEGEAIPVASFLQSVSVPAGDAIGYYGFYEAGNGDGSLSLNGVTEPDNTFIFVLPTQLDALQYVGGATPGSDTISVVAFDYNAAAFTQTAQLTATTMAPGTVSAAPPSYGIEVNADTATPDGTSGSTPYGFTVYRLGDTSQATTLDYTVTGSGTNPAPTSLFSNPSGTVSLAAGVSSAALTINAAAAALPDPESFTVTLSGGNGTVAMPSASDTIGANSAAAAPSVVTSNLASPDGSTAATTTTTTDTTTTGTTTTGTTTQPLGTVSTAISGGSSTAAPTASATSATSSGTSSANATLDPGVVALNATAVYGFANTSVPDFTSVVNQDGSADLAQGASALTPAFIGGYVAGIELRVMANLETIGASTASIDGQFGHDMDPISNLLTAGSIAEGFGFLAGLTTGGATGLAGGIVPVALQTDIATALGTDQQATSALAGCIVGAARFAQGYINNISAGQGVIAALHGVEAPALS